MATEQRALWPYMPPELATVTSISECLPRAGCTEATRHACNVMGGRYVRGELAELPRV